MSDWKLDDARLEELIEAVRRSAHDDGYHRLSIDNPSHETEDMLIVLRDYIERAAAYFNGFRDGIEYRGGTPPNEAAPVAPEALRRALEWALDTLDMHDELERTQRDPHGYVNPVDRNPHYRQNKSWARRVLAETYADVPAGPQQSQETP